MAAANAQVLREYLVSLGFKTDEVSQRRFDLGLAKADMGIMSIGKRLLGVAAAAAAMTALYARSMERLYYSTKRAESSAGNLMSLEYAAKNIGISGEGMTAAIEGLARSLRANPGLIGLLESLGIQTTGRDRADVLLDLVEKLREMPFYIGQQYASMFGMDPDTFLLLSQGLEKLRAAQAAQKNMVKDMGADVESAMETFKQYSELLRQVQERFTLLTGTVLEMTLPAFKQVTSAINDALSVMGQWLGQTKKAFNDAPGDKLDKFKAGYSTWVSSFWKGLFSGIWNPSTPADRRASGNVYSQSSSKFDGVLGDPQAALNMLETEYGLPKGILDRIWARESARGKNKGPSRAGAKGDFQFMDDTAKQYGVDVTDFYSSADGAARYIRDLLNQFGGDIQKAAAAYNWGPGNLTKYGLGAAPAETQAYVESVTGRPIHIESKTDIHVNGSPDPAATGRAVAREQDGVTNNIVRNLRSNVQ